MAKRGIDEHPKTIDFAEALGIPVCYAVGVFELFVHWVAKYRPNGDLTGIKPASIAVAIRFPGTGAQLMEALKEAGFIDEVDGMILVHDWSEHADNSVHQLLKKRGEKFADGCEPFTRNRSREASKKSPESETGVNDSQPEPRDKTNGSQTVHEPFTNDSQTVHPSRTRPPRTWPEPEPEPVNTDTNVSAPTAGEIAGDGGSPIDVEVIAEHPEPGAGDAQVQNGLFPAKPEPDSEPGKPPNRNQNPDWIEVETVLRGVNVALGGDESAEIPAPDIRRYLNPRSSLRQLVAEVGIQTAIDLKVWAAKVKTTGLDWGILYKDRATFLHQMRNPVQGRSAPPRESVVDQAEEAKRRMRERLGVAA